MNLTQYMERKRELLQLMSKIRTRYNHKKISQKHYEEQLCSYIKESYKLDLEYGKELGFSFE